MRAEELSRIVEDFFGYKARMLYCKREIKEVGGILYDAFYFKCDVNDRYDRFGAGIELGGGEGILTDFLGRRCSLNGDEKSIRESLQIIDDYCRMRLPDKFLEAYDAAYSSMKYPLNF